jgi:hypothetical protein
VASSPEAIATGPKAEGNPEATRESIRVPLICASNSVLIKISYPENAKYLFLVFAVLLVFAISAETFLMIVGRNIHRDPETNSLILW